MVDQSLRGVDTLISNMKRDQVTGGKKPGSMYTQHSQPSQSRLKSNH